MLYLSDYIHNSISVLKSHVLPTNVQHWNSTQIHQSFCQRLVPLTEGIVTSLYPNTIAHQNTMNDPEQTDYMCYIEQEALHIY